MNLATGLYPAKHRVERRQTYREVAGGRGVIEAKTDDIIKNVRASSNAQGRQDFCMAFRHFLYNF